MFPLFDIKRCKLINEYKPRCRIYYTKICSVMSGQFMSTTLVYNPILTTTVLFSGEEGGEEPSRMKRRPIKGWMNFFLIQRLLAQWDIMGSIARHAARAAMARHRSVESLLELSQQVDSFLSTESTATFPSSGWILKLVGIYPGLTWTVIWSVMFLPRSTTRNLWIDNSPAFNPDRRKGFTCATTLRARTLHWSWW